MIKQDARVRVKPSSASLRASSSKHEGSVPIPIGTKDALPQEWQRYYDKSG